MDEDGGKNGHFVISLDFEMFWGVRDKRTIENYGEEIEGVITFMPKLLNLFDKFDVGATFAIIGFLFAKNKYELKSFLPNIKPTYLEENFSPYGYLLNEVKDDTLNKYLFADNLIKYISNHSLSEIATHTFSHYYCLEKGQRIEQFEADIFAAKNIAQSKGHNLKSLVFPRNQFNPEYIEICRKQGITSYRGNEKSWFYKASNGSGEILLKRIFRLLDSYINISGHNTYKYSRIKDTFPYNIPSSRFLRPYSKKLKYIENLRLARIMRSMTNAAKKNEIFHIWWHPHNFGVNQGENLEFLERILVHYSVLNEAYGFKNITMLGLSEKLQNGKQ